MVIRAWFLQRHRAQGGGVVHSRGGPLVTKLLPLLAGGAMEHGESHLGESGGDGLLTAQRRICVDLGRIVTSAKDRQDWSLRANQWAAGPLRNAWNRRTEEFSGTGHWSLFAPRLAG